MLPNQFKPAGPSWTIKGNRTTITKLRQLTCINTSPPVHTTFSYIFVRQGRIQEKKLVKETGALMPEASKNVYGTLAANDKAKFSLYKRPANLR